MPIPEQRDPEVARKTLTDWLSAKMPDAKHLHLSPPTTPGGTGFSSETLMFDATWDGGTGGFVLRVEPTTYRLFLDTEFEPQFRVMKAFADRTDVPMPPMLFFEPDTSVLGAPFYVMGKVDGRPPPDSPPYHSAGWLKDEATPAQREKLWWSGLETLVKIHTAPLDFHDLLDRPHRGATGLEQQIAYYREYYDWTRGDLEVPLIDEAFSWVDAHRPKGEPVALCWGDARIGNMLFRDYECVAVLDWEMVTLGNQEQDLAWFLYLDRFHSEPQGIPRLEGLPSHEATIARYEALTGGTIRNLQFYNVFAGLRFAVILLRIGALMSEYGLSPGGRPAGIHMALAPLLTKDMQV